MGHNISVRKRTGIVMRSPISDFAGWSLLVDCGGPQCSRDRLRDVAALAREHPERTVAGTLHRMRCRTCGRGTALARLVPGPDMDTCGTATVALIGPGSY
jgi:hypothetical protein